MDQDNIAGIGDSIKLVIIPTTFSQRMAALWGLARMQWRLLTRGGSYLHPYVANHLYVDLQYARRAAMEHMMVAAMQDGPNTDDGADENRKPTVH